MTPPPVDGAYCVANNTDGWTWFAELFWLDIGDNSPDPNGYMMVVNADYTPGIFYQRTVNVCQNTPYIFSADIINLFLPQFPAAILPNVDFLINGNVVYSTGDIPMDMTWHTYEFAMTPSPTTTQFTFALRNNALGGFGNDLCLDNISLRFCGPKITVPQVVSNCGGVLAVQPIFEGNPWQNAFYQWQTSMDGGQNWSNIPGANGPTLNAPNPQAGQQFRLLMAGAQANLGDPFCRAVSNVLTIETPVYQGFTQATVCEGESLSVAGNSFSQTGNYQIPLVAANGCDSLLHLNLMVLATSATSLQAAICEGETFAFGNQTLSASGDYQMTLTNSLGCDSTVTLHLEVNQNVVVELFEQLCEGGSYNFGGQILAASGEYQTVGSTASGCDSTTMLHLEILPQLSTNLEVQICEGVTYLFDNQSLSFSGNYQVLLQTTSGCDSLISLNLTVLPVTSQQVSASICQGSSYQFGNQQLSAAGIYQQVFQTAGGCDSTVVLELSVQPVFASQISASICEGNAYLFNNQQVTATGQYQQMLQTVAGCDSLVTLNLIVLPQISTNLTAKICQGNSFHFGNSELSVAGIYEENLMAINGCDSLVRLTLEVLPTATTILAAQICEGEAFTFGNLALNTTGHFVQSYQTWQGCDSTVTLDLEALPVFTTDIFPEICEGESFGGAFYQQDVLLLDTLTSSVSGCDSIVRTHLKVWPKVQVMVEAFRCWGEEFAGQRVFSDTTIVLLGQTAHGCDSFTVCNIEVSGKIELAIAGPTSICAGETAILNAGIFTNYLWSNGQQTAEITVHSGGDYHVTVSDSEGCTKAASHLLRVSEPRLEIELVAPRCHGEQNGELHLGLSGGIEPYRVASDGGDFVEQNIMNGLAAGNHEIVIFDSLDCVIREEIYLPEPPIFEVIASESQTIKLGESVVFDVQSNLPVADFEWSPSIWLSCNHCQNPEAMPFETTNYQLKATSEKGCKAESGVQLIVRKEDDIYVPTAFSPNGDGINDFFTLYPGRSINKIRQFLVFDRWGEQVFGTWNAPPFHPSTHWNGDFRGMPAQPSVFVWMAEIEYIDGSTRLLKGEVVLVK